DGSVGPAYSMKTPLLATSAALLAMLVSACSNADHSKREPADAGHIADAGDAASHPPREEPTGPAADVSEEIADGSGAFIGAANGLVVSDGYVVHEYVASGTAT